MCIQTICVHVCVCVSDFVSLIVLDVGSSNAQFIISNFGIMFQMCEIHMQLANVSFN